MLSCYERVPRCFVFFFSFPLNLLLSAKAAISLRPLIQLAMTGQNARLAVSLA